MFIVLYSRIWTLFLHQSAPVRSVCNPTNTEVAQLSNEAVGAARFVPMGSNQKQRCGSKFAKWHDIYRPEKCADEWRQNNADIKYCVMNGFIMFMTATALENSPQSFDVCTVSQSCSVLTTVENSASEITPQSIEELRNGHVSNLQKLLCQPGSKNGVI